MHHAPTTKKEPASTPKSAGRQAHPFRCGRRSQRFAGRRRQREETPVLRSRFLGQQPSQRGFHEASDRSRRADTDRPTVSERQTRWIDYRWACPAPATRLHCDRSAHPWVHTRHSACRNGRAVTSKCLPATWHRCGDLSVRGRGADASRVSAIKRFSARLEAFKARSWRHELCFAGLGVQMLGIGGLLGGGFADLKQIRPPAAQFEHPGLGNRVRPLADGLRTNPENSGDGGRSTADKGKEFLLGHAGIVTMITQQMQASLQRTNVMCLT